MEKRTKIIIAAALMGFAIVAIVAAPFFLPKDSVQLDQRAPPGMETGDVEVHRDGTWKGADAGHKASGSIALVTVNDTVYLRFEDFTMTSGPDVYLYLTRSPDARTTAQIEGDGIRVPVVTDEDPDARINERGSFFVPLDMDLEAVQEYQGVAAWCDDFNVLFANAALA